MTDQQQHPITPPPELVSQIHHEALHGSDGQIDFELRLIHSAYRAGADQELEACCEWLAPDLLYRGQSLQRVNDLRAARRPKPKSQAEKALTALEKWTEDEYGEVGLIRAALERLRELEGGND